MNVDEWLRSFDREAAAGLRRDEGDEVSVEAMKSASFGPGFPYSVPM